MNTTASDKSTVFSCETFNLRAVQFPDTPSKWKHRCELLAQKITDSSASIVGVQELLPSMKHDLESILTGYKFVGCGRNYRHRNGSFSGEHTDILVRKADAECISYGTFWLSGTPDIPGSRNFFSIFPRICTCADIRIAESTIRVYNTHLDHISRRVRRRQFNVILRHMESTYLHKPCPIILMGDFNSTPDSSELRQITTNSTIHLRSAYNGSGTSFVYPFMLGERLFDHIFVSDDITVNNAYIDRTEPSGSDHYPVAASLSIKHIGGNIND